MIKSTKVALKFTNKNKREHIKTLLAEYKNVMSKFIDILWDKETLSSLATKSDCNQINTWLSARVIQCAGKQAIAVIKGTKTKQKRRLYIISKLLEEGKNKEAQKLQRIYDEVSISKPDLNGVEASLDSRFLKIDLDNDTSFDGWLTISSIGDKLKITTPFKKTKHFLKLQSRGELKHSIRLSNNMITFMFELPDPVKQTTGNILGIDIGLTSALSCSNGQSLEKDNHGHTFQSICAKIARKKKGSKAFLKAQRHRTNFLHYIVNQINWENISTLQRENIKNLRKFKRQSRLMQSWNYAELFSILDGKASDLGVQVKKLSPTYTSQRCSKCGYTKKSNRKGKLFICKACGYSADADMNAAFNISLPLVPIRYQSRHQYDNRTGFYWGIEG